MPYGLTESNIQKIKETISQFPEITDIILYGSRAKGTYKPASDIDLALKGQVDLKSHSDRVGKVL